MRGSELKRFVALGRLDIDHDDLLRSRQPCAFNGAAADPAAANHNDDVAGTDVRGIDGRTPAGGYTAAGMPRSRFKYAGDHGIRSFGPLLSV